MSSRRETAGRYGAHVSWARTVDRSARTRPARAASPSSVEYHYDRLDPALFAEASEKQKRDAAEAARHAYFSGLAMKSAASRRKGGEPDAAA